MTVQDDASSSGLWISGKGWFAHVPAALVPWVMRGMSLVLIWIGYALIKGAGQIKKFGGRITFAPTERPRQCLPGPCEE